MTFWILAAIALAIAAFITCQPLFRPKSGWTPIALALVFVLPTGALMLYPYTGTPEALDQVATLATHSQVESADDLSDIDALVDGLRARLTESAEHLDGWVLLSNTLKTMQRYPEALEALETAQRIAPENARVAVELVETRIFLSQQGRITGEMVAELEQAVTRDPSQQKGLWLLGIASSQSGDDEQAIDYWQTLLQQLETGGASAVSVQDQITQAQRRLGIEPDVRIGVDEDAASVKLHLSAGDELEANMPSGAILFVIIRPAGAVAGPPLGVRRINNPTLPLELSISDEDSMMADRMISSESELQLQARLSLSGTPTAQSGDWQSAAVTATLETKQTVQLVLDQRL